MPYSMIILKTQDGIGLLSLKGKCMVKLYISIPLLKPWYTRSLSLKNFLLLNQHIHFSPKQINLTTIILFHRTVLKLYQPSLLHFNNPQSNSQLRATPLQELESALLNLLSYNIHWWTNKRRTSSRLYCLLITHFSDPHMFKTKSSFLPPYRWCLRRIQICNKAHMVRSYNDSMKNLCSKKNRNPSIICHTSIKSNPNQSTILTPIRLSEFRASVTKIPEWAIRQWFAKGHHLS